MLRAASLGKVFDLRPRSSEDNVRDVSEGDRLEEDKEGEDDGPSAEASALFFLFLLLVLFLLLLFVSFPRSPSSSPGSSSASSTRRTGGPPCSCRQEEAVKEFVVWNIRRGGSTTWVVVRPVRQDPSSCRRPGRKALRHLNLKGM